ncbi:hypothetical protein CDD82_5518 [Ophiocordyceps australis]|uniref:Kinetochore complex Sim4 subunit Fta1 n=1 Tax=Ophiocordyceps australis TaxID=1399860 RepID=A0A2C5ZS00_9HYPO|nr:hypothetical protein CDD82_5518 [Ophiocordyceps australis]
MAKRKPQADGDSNATETEEANTPPFFNTTFSTHRVSPLYIGPEPLTQARLDSLAQRLRDTLVGDVVRGIQIGLEATDTPAGQVGTLRAVTIGWFQPDNVLGQAATSAADQDLEWEQQRGLWISIQHENAAYAALLMPGLANGAPAKRPVWATEPQLDVNNKHFLDLPLLLLRMPQPLKAVVGEWLSTTFDCRVNQLSLGTKTLVNVLEGWINTVGLASKGPDLSLRLSFNLPRRRDDRSREPGSETDGEEGEAGLRTMEVAISSADLQRFVVAGQAEGPYRAGASASWQGDARQRRILAGSNTDDGWGWRADEGTESSKHPFTEALARYLDHHLALNLFHPSVRVVQVTCGAFVLAQSRLKVVKLGGAKVDLGSAAWMFVGQLATRIRDTSMAVVA